MNAIETSKAYPELSYDILSNNVSNSKFHASSNAFMQLFSITSTKKSLTCAFLLLICLPLVLLTKMNVTSSRSLSQLNRGASLLDTFIMQWEIAIKEDSTIRRNWKMRRGRFYLEKFVSILRDPVVQPSSKVTLKAFLRNSKLCRIIFECNPWNILKTGRQCSYLDRIKV